MSFLEREDSSELEDELVRETKIIDYRSYDQFLREINELEEDGEKDMGGLFEVLRNVDLCEIGKFVYFLNQAQVYIVFRVLEKYFELFPIVAIRFCKELIRVHSYFCENNKEVYRIYSMMKERCKEIVDLVGCNKYEFAMLYDFQ